jgi:hypothetical protein
VKLPSKSDPDSPSNLSKERKVDFSNLSARRRQITELETMHTEEEEFLKSKPNLKGKALKAVIQVCDEEISRVFGGSAEEA